MDTLGARIRAVRGSDSQDSFAALIGVSKGSLGFYERDKNLPNTDVVTKICSLKGISPSWLLFGQGPMYDQDRITVERARAGTLQAGRPIAEVVVKGGLPQDAPGADAQQARRGDPLDADLLETVIEVVEEVLEESGRELAPDKKAKLIVAIYDLYQDSEREVDKSSVLRLVKSVA